MVDVREPLPILLYHGVFRAEDDFARMEPPDAAYAVTRELLVQHLDALRNAGYKIYGDVEAALDGTGRRVVVTFDDSLPTHTLAAEILAERGVRGLFLLCTDEIGRQGRIDSKGADRLVQAGMLLGSHGERHEFLTALDEDRLKSGLESSLAALRKWPGAARPVLSFPGGRYTLALVNVARRAGFKRFLTSERGVNDADLRPAVLCRINVTQKIGPDQLLGLVGRSSVPLKERWAQRTKLVLRAALGDQRYLGMWNAWHRRNSAAGK